MSRRAAGRERPFPIVGIGASAGGLEALSRLLASLPTDADMAFVVIQHLDPHHKSLLPLILQKSTALPVLQATNGMRIEPAHVYVIPPGKQMTVARGRLHLTPRTSGVQATSVDSFLISLAEERGNNGIAVILSGTASDGALGVKAVKAEGGVVFAQDERSAGQAGMPHAAVATGAVDYVMPPEEIAAELKRISRHPALHASAIFSDSESLKRIFAAVGRSTGVDFSLYKPSTIQRRVQRRLLLNKLDSLKHYADKLERNADETRALHDDLLIHVTHFFREPAQHEALRAKVLPRILRALPADAPIRVWVPGCSSGEEPYSLAITLLDYLGERDVMNPIQIFATDISEPALEKARAGLYPHEIQDEVPPRLLRRFFTKDDRGYQIAKRVRDLCVFARHDLTKDPPFANLDLICCCNVLIYLSPAAQQEILPMFHYALRPAGALLLSKSETVGQFSNLFGLADKKSRLYFKKPAAPPRARASLPAQRAADGAREASEKAKAAASGQWPETDIQKVAERLLLSRFAPAGVIVSGDLNILHFRGRVNRYLEPATGRASLALTKMLPAHAAATVKALIQKAKKSDAPCRAGGLAVGGDGAGALEATVEVIPFRLPLSGQRYFIVLFEEEGLPGGRRAAHGREASAVRETSSVKRLKSELASARSYLQTIVEEHEAANEELKSANEEIVSSNEELQSTNEELEIAKEELQAANEELTTLNDELQNRNGELGQLNNDLTNLIASVHLPIVMVSTDLRIRRFTPAAERIMNVIPTDIGRPIGDIKPKVSLPNVEEVIHDVIETMSIKELETTDQKGRPYLVRVRPYKTIDNKIEGAVVVFIDNSQIRRSSPLVGQPSAFEAALELVRQPLAVIDAQMRVRAASRSMYQAFGLTESQVGRSLFEIDGGRWNVPALRAKLERLASAGEPLTGLRVRVGDRDLEFSARRIVGSGDGPPMILLGIDAPPGAPGRTGRAERRR